MMGAINRKVCLNVYQTAHKDFRLKVLGILMELTFIWYF